MCFLPAKDVQGEQRLVGLFLLLLMLLMRVFCYNYPNRVLGSIISGETLQRNISVSRYSKYVEI